MKACTACGDKLKVAGSISQNTGRAPVRAMVPAVAKKVKGEVMTSSPGPYAQRHQGEQQRIGAGGHPDTGRGPAIAGNFLLQIAHVLAENEMLTGADLVDDGHDLGADLSELGLQIE